MATKGRVGTLLQRIAGERNWLKGFVLKRIYLQPAHYLEISAITRSQLAEVNRQLAELRYLVDLDWDCQRRQIKKEQRAQEERPSNG